MPNKIAYITYAAKLSSDHSYSGKWLFIGKLSWQHACRLIFPNYIGKGKDITFSLDSRINLL